MKRQNKTGLSIVWPEQPSFTIPQLKEFNQHLITRSGLDITLRVKLQQAVAKGIVRLTDRTLKAGPRGRPLNVYETTQDKENNETLTTIRSNSVLADNGASMANQ